MQLSARRPTGQPPSSSSSSLRKTAYRLSSDPQPRSRDAFSSETQRSLQSSASELPSTGLNGDDVDELGEESSDEDDLFSEAPPGTTLLAKKQRNLTRNQRQAAKRFRLLDKGKVNKADVFGELAAGMERVVLKVVYYRKRHELVLPAVEHRFMRRVSQGHEIVDVHKVSTWKRGAGREKASATLATSADSFSADPLLTKSCWSTSRSALHSSASMESLLQRAERLQERAHERDDHIRNVRETERAQLSARRHEQLSKLEAKAARKETAGRQRVLLTWLAASAAMQTLVEARREHVRIWENLVKNRLGVGNLDGDSKKAAVSGAAGDAGAQRSWPRSLPSEDRQLQLFSELSCREYATNLGSSRMQSLALALSSVQSRFAKEVQYVRSKRAQTAWGLALAAVRFVRLHLRAKRMKRNAEVIKLFISDTWRYFQTRRSMRVIAASIRTIQRKLKVAFQRRKFAKEFVMLAIWEEETRILCGMTGVPAEVQMAEIEEHRRTALEALEKGWREALLGQSMHKAPLQSLMAAAMLLQWRRRAVPAWARAGSARAAAGEAGMTKAVSTKQAMTMTGTLSKPSLTMSSRPSTSLTRATSKSAMMTRTASKPSQPQTGMTRASSKGRRPSHLRISQLGGGADDDWTTMMHTLERYRLPPEKREQVCSFLISDCVERFWVQYCAYKRRVIEVAQEVREREMLLEVLDGDEWGVPPEPQLPDFPHVLLDVDLRLLHTEVRAMLQTTEAGQLLRH